MSERREKIVSGAIGAVAGAVALIYYRIESGEVALVGDPRHDSGPVD